MHILWTPVQNIHKLHAISFLTPSMVGCTHGIYSVHRTLEPSCLLTHHFYWQVSWFSSHSSLLFSFCYLYLRENSETVPGVVPWAPGWSTAYRMFAVIVSQFQSLHWARTETIIDTGLLNILVSVKTLPHCLYLSVSESRHCLEYTCPSTGIYHIFFIIIKKLYWVTNHKVLDLSIFPFQTSPLFKRRDS